MSDEPQRWFPSRRSQAAEWYLRQCMRYLVGGGSIAWELLADHGKNPLVLLIGAMLATSTDVLGIVRALISQAKMERRTLEELVSEEQRREEDKR